MYLSIILRDVQFLDFFFRRIFLPYTASLCIAFSMASTLICIFKLNLSGIHTQSTIQKYLDFMPFLILSTFFKISALIVIEMYLSYSTALPVAILLMTNVVISEKKLKNNDDLQFPKVLMIILSLFAPICFTKPKKSEKFFKIQTDYFIWQTLASVVIYGITIIIICLLVNLSLLEMFEKLTITNTEFNIYVASIMVMGIGKKHAFKNRIISGFPLNRKLIEFIILPTLLYHK